ncbi:MAG: hypothetical protein ACK5KT_08280 [Dysgonomonas sp.]
MSTIYFGESESKGSKNQKKYLEVNDPTEFDLSYFLNRSRYYPVIDTDFIISLLLRLSQSIGIDDISKEIVNNAQKKRLQDLFEKTIKTELKMCEESTNRIISKYSEGWNDRYKSDITTQIFSKYYTYLSDLDIPFTCNYIYKPLLDSIINQAKEVLEEALYSFSKRYDVQTDANILNEVDEEMKLKVVQKILILDKLKILDFLENQYPNLKDNKRALSKVVNSLLSMNEETVRRAITDIKTGSKNDPYRNDDNINAVESILLKLGVSKNTK